LPCRINHLAVGAEVSWHRCSDIFAAPRYQAAALRRRIPPGRLSRTSTP